MKLPLSPFVAVRRRRVQDQLANLLAEAVALGIDPTAWECMTLLAWKRVRDGRAA